MRQRFAISLIALALCQGAAGVALSCEAADYKPCTSDCGEAAFDPYAGLGYDDAKHAAWYRRFWTGKCEGLGFFDFCVSDEAGWPGAIADALDRAAQPDRPALQTEMRSLGRLIGHEWARANDVRSIDTDDLKRWRDVLADASDPRAGVAAICGEAKALLAGGRPR